MRVLVDVGHPGHVHFYKHAICRLQDKGHEVLVSARDKDVTLALLEHYGFAYRTLSSIGRGRVGLLWEFVRREQALLHLIRELDPDAVTAIGGAFIAPICRLLGKPSIVFTDTEHVAIDRYLTYPFASVICTPECFKLDLGSRHIRYAGYQEMAYLHPNWFIPNPEVLHEIGLTKKDTYFIVRFVSWGAAHDVGYRGFSDLGKRHLIAALETFGRVMITSETRLHPDFEPYRMSISPAKIHDLLAYSALYIGEGATMASEAALLGVPSIYVNPLTLGYLEDEERYGLLYRLPDESEAIERAIALINTPDIRAEWQLKRQRLLQDKIDVTAWMVDFVEGYVLETKTKEIMGSVGL